MDANQLGVLVKLLNPMIEEKIQSLITNSMLTDIEKDVVKKRRFHNMTLEDVGKEYGVTRERIRQVEAKAFRKLRQRPSNTLHELIPIQEMSRLKESLNILSEYLNEKSEPLLDEADAFKRMSIDDLELSVRPYNTLKRAGIHTVYDLTQYSLDDLMRVRNLGRHSYNEIVEKVENVPDFEWRGEDDE